MMSTELRWKQRFANFSRAFSQLEQAVSQIDSLSRLEKEGLVQRFEYTFELAWKTLKDYLESQSVDAKFPREVIKQSFFYEIIADGETWMDMLEKRNLMAHTYDENNFLVAVQVIVQSYYPAIKQLYCYLGDKQ
jgi:nucleotidyltransferase substrate binding protein (TIGR01987 family)